MNKIIPVIISLSISFLINMNRFFSIVYPEWTYFNDVEGDSITVFLYRFVFFALYCWMTIQIATRKTPIFLSQFTRIQNGAIYIIIIAVLAKIAYHLFTWSHSLLFFEIIQPERSGIRYVWVVMGLASLLIGWLLRFQKNQKINALEKEYLIQENTQSELLALNNQINPHFLFNSLNTLKYIIQENKDDSIQFVDQLATLYRYILQSSNKSLVPLQKELDFIYAYIYLVKARYEDNFNVQIKLTLNTESISIPILSLQLLIENAIKHNEISKEHPLEVTIYNTENAIIVENEIRPKNQMYKSTNQGLKNLSRRYQLLKNKKIIIENGFSFKAILPIN